MPQRRERVLQRLIEDEMRESFLDYSMSVIVQRALPDVRDGLKPVHRRILYAMHELGLAPNRPFKKSAAVVGEVLGKYHPHGDTAVYDAIVRIVQDFSLSYPLVDGQGNFGSIDGDSAAAYRYTEARLASAALELLADIEKDTVPAADTFDGQRQEPEVLPARLPNLLVNGSSGIAVGMATNIPPHNLREVAAAVGHLVRHPECAVDHLMQHVPGPDFPTGGFILGAEGIQEAYRTGRGRIVMRARVQKEARRGGKEQLVVTELPYGISKARVIEQIAELVRARRMDDIADLRDESDRDGMRIVIELKRGAKSRAVLNLLYRHTYLQATFGAILLALDQGGVPHEFNLKELIERYRDHRLEVIRRRSRFELEHARAEAHVTRGLLLALAHMDAVVVLIRKARDREEAASGLRQRFELSAEQADAILNMRLARLTALERQELREKLDSLENRIAELERLLASEQQQLDLLLGELEEIVERFGDARRTTIVRAEADFAVEDLVAREEFVIAVSHAGYIQRVPLSLYGRRVSGGKPPATEARQDFLERVFLASTRDTLLAFSREGQAYAISARDVPETGRSGRGRSLAQLLKLEGRSPLAALLPVSDFPADRALLFLTAHGTVKRTTLDHFAHIRSGGTGALNLRPGDVLLDVQLSDGASDAVIVSGQGRGIRFPEADVPLMGRAAQGVRGMRLRRGDHAVGIVVVRREASLCMVTRHGFAKRTPVSDYPVQRRGGLGVTALQVTERTGPLVAAKELLAGDELMVIAASGAAARLPADRLPLQGRATQGRPVISLAGSDPVVEVARVAHERETPPEPPEPSEPGGGTKQLELIAVAGE
ncbi:MAG: DNA gyrase subunit A [Gemmatimonadetes bacterium]|nr:DNA gyrase subunit A [Gemmatimonadota bacterium]